MKLYEILVPTVSNDGKPFRLKHHKVWDKKVLDICGGLSIMAPLRGQWVSDKPELYIDRNIPVRIACDKEQLDQIIQFTLIHYNQLAVMAYKISDEVYIVKSKENIMSTFETPVVTIKEVADIEGADVIGCISFEEIDYQVVGQKWEYKKGDKVLYCPEDSILPKWLVDYRQIKLSGPNADRVKAIKLRGVLSQGVIAPVHSNVELIHLDADKNYAFKGLKGHDFYSGTFVGSKPIHEQLGITKYVPTVPEHFGGDVATIRSLAYNYDIENIKKNKNLIKEGQECWITEKLHGTLCSFRYDPNDTIKEGFGPDKNIYPTSKGMGQQGFMFKDYPINAGNVYVKALKYHLENDIAFQGFVERNKDTKWIMFGELFGEGIQDLTYSTKPQFRIFDILQDRGFGMAFIDPSDIYESTNHYATNKNDPQETLLHEMEEVPYLYHGPFSQDILDLYTNGVSSIDNKTIREGVVIKSFTDQGERIILKSVSEKYLLRKNKNATEFN